MSHQLKHVKFEDQDGTHWEVSVDEEGWLYVTRGHSVKGGRPFQFVVPSVVSFQIRNLLNKELKES
jgi:hypothetical protein